MNALHLKVEQNKQVKQLWSGATDILKRSEQPHSGQLIWGSFLKKTLIEGWSEMKVNEWAKEKWQSGNKKRTFFRKTLWRFSRRPASTGSTFNSGAASSTQSCQGGNSNMFPCFEKWDQIHTSYESYISSHKSSKFSCCDFNLLYRRNRIMRRLFVVRHQIWKRL